MFAALFGTAPAVNEKLSAPCTGVPGVDTEVKPLQPAR